MNVLIPVSYYKVGYQVASGRPFSFFERLVLEGISQGVCSLEQLTDTFRVHQRVVIEVVVSLMQTGWVAINRENHNLIMTQAGETALRRDTSLPSNIVVQDRTGHVVGERVAGQVVRSTEIIFVSKQNVKKSIKWVAVLPPSNIPHVSDLGQLAHHLNIREGEWLRSCGAVTIVRNAADYVVVNVNHSGQVTGLPNSWQPQLEGMVVDAARAKEEELTQQNILQREDDKLGSFVRDYTQEALARKSLESQQGEGSKQGHFLQDPQLGWMSLEVNHDHLVMGRSRHRTLLTHFLEQASFLFIATPSWTIQGVEEWAELLIDAQSREALVGIVVGGPTLEGWPNMNSVIEVLRSLDSKPDDGDISCWQPLIAGKGPSHCQSTVVIADMGGTIEAMVGSSNWLDVVPTTDGEGRTLSMHFTEPQVVARLARVAADLATADGLLVQGCISQHLQGLAGVLDQYSVQRSQDRKREANYSAYQDGKEEQFEGLEDQDQEALQQGSFVARILIGAEHRAILPHYAKQAKKCLIVAGGEWSADLEPVIKALQDAAKQLCPRIELHYQQWQADQSVDDGGVDDGGVDDGGVDDGGADQREPTEQERSHLDALGVTIHGYQGFVPCFAIQDSSRAVITGFNWLSPCSNKVSSSSVTEIGVEIQGGDLVSQLLSEMNIPEEREQVPKLSCAYLQAFSVKGLRSVAEIHWKRNDDTPAPGWHVLIGNNGSGKTTILRALALALMGPKYSDQLKTEWSNWLRDGENQAHVDVILSNGELYEDSVHDDMRMVWQRSEADHSVELEHDCGEKPCVDVISMGYGALRWFGGGTGAHENKFSSFPALERHLSLYDEDYPLNGGLSWLIELQHHALLREDGASVSSMLLAQIKRLINECNLFPAKVTLQKISPDGVVFCDEYDKKFTFRDLSEGYRAVLGMTIDIIRHLSIRFGPGQLFDPEQPTIVIAPAIVLIDEVDAHLHPEWQQNIGLWLVKHFPNIQFIVTTHSILICHAADQGTVFRLPEGQALWKQESEEGRQGLGELLEGETRGRLLYGNMVEAYGSGAFGNIQRSRQGTRKLNRLARLNCLELERDLSEGEEQEQTHLRSIFPTNAYIERETDIGIGGGE